MTEPLKDENMIPRELLCEIIRERAVLIGMEACSRAMQIPEEAIRTINASHAELIQNYNHIQTYDELDVWSDSVMDAAKGLSV